jgi:MFS family permease
MKACSKSSNYFSSNWGIKEVIRTGNVFVKINTTVNNVRQWISDLTIGGSWGQTQSAPVQRNLRWFWFDGLFSSAHDNIYLNFISLYILVLGATQAQIGLMSSLSNLTAALLLLPGAFIAERFIHKVKETLVIGGSLMRLAVLLLVFVPIFFKGASLVWVAILVTVLRDGFGNLGYPGWVTVTNEVVPLEGRGRYFGSRNFIMSVSGIIVTLLAGKLITLFSGQLGYQIVIGIAFILGALSIFSFSHIKIDPEAFTQVERPKLSARLIIGSLKGQPFFLTLMLTAAVWNLAINIAGPFFSVYMLQDLKFTASEIGLLSVITTLSALLVQNKIGSLADRLGARKIQLFGMILIPLLPLAWIIASNVWHVALINVASGVVWGAYNLASFNLLLESMPTNQVPIFTAIYQVVVALSLALGALIGSAIISHWGFVGVLLASAVLRFLATGLFGKYVKTPQKLPA